MVDEDLIQAAIQVRTLAYCPYSGYKVGAAIRDERGTIFVGTNVENASYGGTICAERCAIVSMVAGGGNRLQNLVVVTQDGGSPCGLCLQVISEFADRSLPIVLVSESGERRQFTLESFLPMPFELKAD